MKPRIMSSARNAWLILPLLFAALTLGACYETSYDKAIADLNAGGGTTPPPTTPPQPPPPPPPPTGFGPNFSEIQAAVFTPSCATSGCHVGVNPPASLNLEAGNSYMMLVGVASSQNAGIQRVAPNDPDNSYLIQKLEGNAGAQMPPSSPLDQADINTIRQWISAGAVDDTAQASLPIKVQSLSVTPGGTLDTAPTQITAQFDRQPDPSTVNLNTFVLEDSSNTAITATSISVPGANPQSAVFVPSAALADDTYTLRLLGSGASFIMDMDANALDGEYSGTFPSGNDVEGGDFVVQFTISTPVVNVPTLAEIQANIFTPSCATAGCHNAGTQAAQLSLADAATSYLELVNEFSGQTDVLLVAPNEPDNSYLVRKIEGVNGISGNRMPPGGALPQSDIDAIRQWIEGGAQP